MGVANDDSADHRVIGARNRLYVAVRHAGRAKSPHDHLPQMRPGSESPRTVNVGQQRFAERVACR